MKSVVSISGLISAWEFWQVNDRQSSMVDVLFTIFSDFFRVIKLYIILCHYELCWNTEILVKLDKKLRNYICDRYLIQVSYNNASFLITLLFKKMLLKISDNCSENTSVRYGCWNVAKIEIFIICIIFTLYQVLNLIIYFIFAISSYIFIIYSYVYYNLFNFVIYFYFHIIWF